MHDNQNEQDYEFEVNRWLSRKEDDCDVWRELAFVHPDETPLPGRKLSSSFHSLS